MRTVPDFAKMKAEGRKIVSLTAYDYPTALLEQEAGIDFILVGDSIAMAVLGEETTLGVTVDMMLPHVRAVRKGAPETFVVAAMPFGSYQASDERAVDSAGRLVAEGGADAVKLEGGAFMAETVRFLVERGVPVCAHIGLTPQAVHQLGGYRVQGRSEEGAARLKADAHALEQAGAALMVMEMVPATLAAEITASLKNMATIGIGAGPGCDGQVLVLHDLLGVFPGKTARFVRNFMEGAASIEEAVARYAAAVKDGSFPAAEHCY